jgi:transcriptional/translational regulatory protein YebC/TACO1
MTDDFLSPDDHTPPAGADTEEHLAEDVGLDPSDDDEDNDDVQDVYANFDIPERVLEVVAS